MRSAAKQRFRQSRPSSCVYCGSLTKCDMYRHVACFLLDLAQLWRCPVSWCTVWKGTPQDYMDHLRGSHDVPWEVKSASLEKFLPPWTVSRNVWSDALSAQHSGLSTDVLLFSDIHLSLVHHYRIHKRGLPHIAFWKNYLSQMRALLPLPSRVVSPDSSDSGSLRPGDYPEVVLGPTRTTRRAHRRRRPVRVEELAVVSGPVFTIQDPLAAAVLDCRPPPPRCCLSLWTLEVWSCRRVSLRRCRLVWMDFSPDVSRYPMGGLDGTNLSGAWCGSIGGPRYGHRRRAADTSWFPVGGR